jgi:glycerol-3-phosphate dehydrogenase (NAD(P)+)
MKIIVIGAGAWGTALASAVVQDGAHTVTLWARTAEHGAALAHDRRNTHYLPDAPLPPALECVGGPLQSDAIARADLLVLAAPVQGLRTQLQALQRMNVVPPPLAWLCKGFEADTGLMPHEVCAELAPGWPVGVLSGPSFALEVARGQPTALVAASTQPGVTGALVAALHSPRLRVYASTDVVGVEVGGAVKNVLAIATGLCDGLADRVGTGLNARAALITRGLAEMTRLGLALGARPETFMGLSGLGDLVLTATGHLSRNRQVGLQLAQGKPLADILAQLGHVAEGVACARVVVRRARQLGVEMPIAQAVLAVLDGQLSPTQTLAALMARDPVAE